MIPIKDKTNKTYWILLEKQGTPDIHKKKQKQKKYLIIR